MKKKILVVGFLGHICFSLASYLKKKYDVYGTYNNTVNNSLILVLVKLSNKIIKKSIKFSLPTHKPIFSKILKDLTKSYKSKTKVIDKKSLKISKLQIEIANA